MSTSCKGGKGASSRWPWCAYTALAVYHQERASRQLSKRNARQDVFELNAVAVFLEDAAEHLGDAAAAQAEQVKEQAETLARSLSERLYTA